MASLFKGSPALAPRMFGWLVGLAAILLMSSAAHASPIQVEGLRVVGDASRARIVMDVSDSPDLRWFLLRAPHRLVLELTDVEYLHDETAASPRGLITDIAFTDAGGAKSRMIVTGEGAFVVENVDIMKNEDGAGYRVVVDMVAGSDRQFEAALADQIATTSVTSAGQAPDVPRFTIVIDPGHGGADSGARGVSGVLEKTITLAFGLELKKALEDLDRYDVHMTRDRDRFLRLDERVRIARRHEADLFISIHADAIRHRDVRGATVYTVSETPSDAASAAKAIRENLADQLAGYGSPEESDEVSGILADLVRRETDGFSLRFANALVDSLSSEIAMIKNPHRFAGFQVLKAPDVPSVLVELGYLSNAADEAQLRDVEWRAQATAGIVGAIDRFAGGRIGSTE
ncbi:N-acetylmuramoyl-L-alanine amidase [Aliihoeflea aestuarii]|jgi:N-acetylmuramoyl-L-alanine amidase|uniref:N-acetylmuramoyl-L-alanine amidase n=1 Tax=Aliihoeflea aestuarii TaxID=453840 RepID=UPI002093FF93|nr:N-acetylmuramoyl-L-alanine amidase [Aliihoeflea aestuarii]